MKLLPVSRKNVYFNLIFLSHFDLGCFARFFREINFGKILAVIIQICSQNRNIYCALKTN